MNSQKLDTILDEQKRNSEELIEVLQDIQEIYKYLPEEALRRVSQALEVPLIEVYRVANFYKAFTLQPRGKHLLTVCMGTACHVKGASRILESLERNLVIKAGETTKDKKFTLEAVRCLGCCGLAPVVTVNDDVYGSMTPEKMLKALDKYS